MINITNKKECCGCTACRNICPKDCIVMEADNEGFLYPHVDGNKCVDCGLCEKVCPILNSEAEQPNPNQKGAIVAHKNDEILLQSTSGGAFTAIGEYIIENGGKVFGVEMDSNCHVHHTEVDTVPDLIKFRNSKYVQSQLDDTYRKVKSYLDKGILVCFSGTPCQIEGLRHFLHKKTYENLILVDVVCRAVPSPMVWKSYTDFLKTQHGNLTEVRFRDKGLGYQYSTMTVKCQDGFFSRDGIESDAWLRMFFSGMIIRPSCTDCRFRRRYRHSDLTIWDCFNVSDISKSFDETKGATRVLIHSQKGERLFDAMKKYMQYENKDPEILIKGLTELSKSPQEHKNKQQFFADYQTMPMDKLLQKYYPKTAKVRLKKYGRLALNKLGLDRAVKKMKRKLS